MKTITLSHDPGIGHLWWWQFEESGVVEKRILEEHGAVARWNGALGVHLSSVNRGSCDLSADTVV